MSTWNEEEDGMGFAGLAPEPRYYSSDTNEYADAMVAQGERLAQEADALQTHAYAEGRKDEREEVCAEVLRELLEWEREYMQQARGGDRSGKSDAKADAAREIHDHLRASWETRGKAFDPWEADKNAQMNPATDGDPGLF